MSDYYNERQRRQAWDDDDWQPESEQERWQQQRRRQQLTPGQTSYGGPAPRDGGYSDQYGAGRYPERPTGGDYGSRDDDRYRSSQGRYGPGRSSQGQYGGSEGRYGGNESRYGGSEQSSGSREDWYRGNEQPRYQGEGYGGRRAGSSLRYGLNGGSGWERAGEWRNPQAWQRDDDNAERQWQESAQRARDPYESARSGNRDRSFSELRSDTRYWTEPGNDWEDQQRRGGRGGYSREAARQRGWETGDREEYRKGYRGDEHEDHGMLYNLGRRIGEAVGDLFGTSEDHERRAGPRGYQRSDDRIRDQICERLSYARGVDVSDVSVDVSNGVVSLTGSVRDRGQKYYIEDLADGTYGVTEVNNDIRVRREGQGGSGTTTGATGTTGTTGTTGSTTTGTTGSTAGTSGSADMSGSTWRA